MLLRNSKHNNNTWGLPGGNMDREDNGDLLVTAKREAIEEMQVLCFKSYGTAHTLCMCKFCCSTARRDDLRKPIKHSDTPHERCDLCY